MEQVFLELESESLGLSILQRLRIDKPYEPFVDEYRHARASRRNSSRKIEVAAFRPLSRPGTDALQLLPPCQISQPAQRIASWMGGGPGKVPDDRLPQA